MYRVNCPAAEAEVSLPSDAILSLHRTSAGKTGYFRCTCGALGVLTVGRFDIEPTLHHPARVAERELVASGASFTPAA
jgi:hypothetical protein